MKNLKYAGMTVNERLYIAAVLDEYDAAIKAADITRVVELLRQVELNDASIEPILQKYGFEMPGK